MKLKLSTGVSILICLVLIVAGLGLGAVRGFSKERENVTSLLEGDSGLMDVLMYRGADGLNLCAVAQRHIAGSEELAGLESISRSLLASGGTLAEKQELDAQLDASVSAVVTLLENTDSYRANVRDQGYISMLKSDLAGLNNQSFYSEYSVAADAFNQKLQNTLFGKIAGFFGVRPCTMDQTMTAVSTALRMPKKRGVLTDDADVLAGQTAEDIEEYADLVEDETDVDLYVALVHFTDGMGAKAYCEKLFDKWNLQDEDLLVLGVTGEDGFAMEMGRDVERKLSNSSVDNLFYTSTAFSDLFSSQKYDQAFGNLFRGMTELLNKQYKENIKLDGLFQNTLTLTPQNQNHFISSSWNNTLGSIGSLQNTFEEGAENGLSAVHWIILVGLLLIIINGSDPVRKAKNKHRQRRR